MTTQERVQALQNFGYDADEARFLSIAALQGGYFLRRQFLTFVLGTKGWKDVALIRKLAAHEHCRINVYRHERIVYHLSSKPLYEALGEPNNRNRRQHQPSTIKNKIMALDFVLEHPSSDFLATEREKLSYFIGVRNIGQEELPTRLYASPHGNAPAAKHFVESYPIFLPTDKDEARVPHFCYVDEGLQTTDRFATYLSQYRRLFRGLGDYQLIYVAEDSRLFASAERVFQKFGESVSALSGAADSEHERLLAYFKRRLAYENRDFSTFDTAGIIHFREEKNHFAGEHYEALYTRWKDTEAARLTNANRPIPGLQGMRTPRFSTYVLDHDYDLFGTLTSKNHKRTDAESPTELEAAFETQVGKDAVESEGRESASSGQDPAGRR